MHHPLFGQGAFPGSSKVESPGHTPHRICQMKRNAPKAHLQMRYHILIDSRTWCIRRFDATKQSNWEIDCIECTSCFYFIYREADCIECVSCLREHHLCYFITNISLLVAPQDARATSKLYGQTTSYHSRSCNGHLNNVAQQDGQLSKGAE